MRIAAVLGLLVAMSPIAAAADDSAALTQADPPAPSPITTPGPDLPLPGPDSETLPGCADDLGFILQSAILPPLPIPAPLPDLLEAPPAPAPHVLLHVPPLAASELLDPPAPPPVFLHTPRFQLFFPAPRPVGPAILRRVYERPEEVAHAEESARCQDGDGRVTAPFDCLLEAAEQLEAGGLPDIAEAVRAFAHTKNQQRIRKLLQRKLSELEELKAEIAQLQSEIQEQKQVVLEIKILDCDSKHLARLGIDFTRIAQKPHVEGTKARRQSGVACVSKEDQALLHDLLKLLEQAQVVSVVAEPTLVLQDGRSGRVQSAGEVIPAAPGVARTVGYREFGVRVDAIASLIGRDSVRLEIQPEIIERDFTNAIQVSGVAVPGLNTRQFATVIEMKLGETAVLCQPSPKAGRDAAKSKQVLVLVTPRLADSKNPSAEAEQLDEQPQVQKEASLSTWPSSR